ncbi:MAG TPA: DUF2975 domain-containing protein [Oscillospiraceae bacterium]|nr:DUF2975 domain-containing protein [Oscillospiraceae bacterium]
MNEKFINSKVYHVLRSVLNLFFWVTAVACLFWLCWLIVSSFVDKTFPHFSIVPNFDGFILTETVSIKSGTTGTLYFFTTLLYVADFFLCFAMLRNIVNSLCNTTPFTQKNVNRIRIMGWSLLAGAYLNELMNYLYAQQIFDSYHKNGTQCMIQPHFSFLPNGVFLALCVIVLAEVFRYGYTLQNEHDTTV